jgi:Undecaprenyl-phosphate galactose phosphotransferase WbaP
MYFSNYYQGFGRSNFSDFRNILINVSLSYIFALVIILALKLFFPSLYFLFFFSWLLSMILFLTFRLMIQNYGAHFIWWRIPVVIVGTCKQVTKVIEKINLPNRLAFNPVAVFLLEKGNLKNSILDIPCVDLTEEQMLEFKKKRIRMAMITESASELSEEFNEIVNKLVYTFPHVVYEIQSPFFEIASIKLVDFFDKSAIQISYNLLSPISNFVKQVLDYMICLASLVIVFPVYLIISVVIKLDTKGSILFIQNRVGLDGKIFKLYKFRTMVEDADEKLVEILKNDTQKSKEFSTYHKLKDDPRVTRIGRFLRKYSLDELPQIINIIRGEMSWVGPRAYLPEEIRMMKSKAKVIQSVKPGLTGWWQVNGRNALTFEERLIMDEQYISRYTLWMDAYILVKTVKVILKGNGV